MSPNDCGVIREWIPDHAMGCGEPRESESVVAHVLTCEDCRAELALVRLLASSGPRVPRGLAQRIQAAVLFERRTVRRPWWGISAAAIAALAIGIGLKSGPYTVVEAPGFAYEASEDGLWLGDDGVIAGAPVLDGLSDEALGELLEELSALGGQA